MTSNIHLFPSHSVPFETSDSIEDICQKSFVVSWVNVSLEIFLSSFCSLSALSKGPTSDWTGRICRSVSRTAASWGRASSWARPTSPFRRSARTRTWTGTSQSCHSCSCPSQGLRIKVTEKMLYSSEIITILLLESDLIYALDSRIYDRHAKDFLKRERRKL